jgi:hypothetical protein
LFFGYFEREAVRRYSVFEDAAVAGAVTAAGFLLTFFAASARFRS